jgi:tetratricopeptide (TPR) repeat protein
MRHYTVPAAFWRFKAPFFLVCFFLTFLEREAAFAQTRPDALAEYKAGNYEQAVSICMNDIAANPGNLESHVVICWSLIRLGRYRDALVYARAGLNISRYDARIIEVLGEINYYEGQNNEALRYIQEYVNLAP